ncbi:MAG: hypothetical protein Q9159_003009 [Coniocarpon cinnabarinum]
MILPRDRRTLGPSMDSGSLRVTLLATEASLIYGRPDNCDGTYQSNCDSEREYKNISQILESFGQQDLLSFMQSNWKDVDGSDESFWEHEWGKHGTCISTLEPSCYTDYTPQEEVVDFFTRTVNLYKGLDTYTFLKNAGIVPSNSKSYTLKSVQAALSGAPGRNGTSAFVDCDDSGAINQVFYYYNVRGSVQTGEFVAADVDGGSKTSCPKNVKYMPKKNGTQPRTSSTGSSARPTATLEGSCRSNEKWSSRNKARSFAY